MKIQKFFTDLFTTLAKKYKIPYNGNCCENALQPVGANQDTGDIYYYDSNTNTYTLITTGGEPADPNRSIQWNNNGVFGGSQVFEFTANQSVFLGGNMSAIGLYSFAQGYNNIAYGSFSHAEGFGTYAGAEFSHTEGADTFAWGIGSHAEGYNTFANGQYSHTGGIGTYATEIGTTIVGKYNSDSGRLFIVGNGVDNLTRSDAFIVDVDLTTILTPILLGSVNEFADNAAALLGGLGAGMVYRTGDNLKIVH